MLKFLRFNIGGFFTGYDEIRLWIYKHSAKYEVLSVNHNTLESYHIKENTRLPINNPDHLSEWDALGVNSWHNFYFKDTISDGTQWRLTYREDGKETRIIYGDNDYPPQWIQFTEWLDSLMPEMHFAKYSEENEDIDEDERNST